MIDFMFVLHLFVMAFIVSTAFLPLNKVKKMYMIPALISISWVIFGQCILSPKSTNADDSDTTRIFRWFIPGIDGNTVSNIVVSIMVMLPTIMFYRLSKTCITR